MRMFPRIERSFSVHILCCTYYPDNKNVVFEASHQGNKVLSLSARLPETNDGHVVVEIDEITPEGSCITPRQNPLKANFVAAYVYLYYFVA